MKKIRLFFTLIATITISACSSSSNSSVEKISFDIFEIPKVEGLTTISSSENLGSYISENLIGGRRIKGETFQSTLLITKNKLSEAISTKDFATANSLKLTKDLFGYNFESMETFDFKCGSQKLTASIHNFSTNQSILSKKSDPILFSQMMIAVGDQGYIISSSSTDSDIIYSFKQAFKSVSCNSSIQ